VIDKVLAYLKARGDADDEIAARGVASHATREAVTLRAFDLADAVCIEVGKKLKINVEARTSAQVRALGREARE
jgi:hypothetical protein